jgi:hypothetical protein
MFTIVTAYRAIDDETFVTLVEGKIDEAGRQAVLDQLNRCHPPKEEEYENSVGFVEVETPAKADVAFYTMRNAYGVD